MRARSALTVGGGALFGLAVAAWFGFSSPTETAATGATQPRRHARAWGVLPLPWLEDAPDETGERSAKVLASLPQWKGGRTPVEIHVLDEDGRPAARIRVAIVVDRTEYEQKVAVLKAPAESGDEPVAEPVPEPEEEGTSPQLTEIETGFVTTGPDGCATAQIVPDVSTHFVANDRGRHGASPVVIAADGEPAPAPVTIELDIPAAIIGTVVDELGAPVVGARVSVSDRGDVYAAEPRAESAVVLSENGELPDVAADGTFKVPLRRGGLFDVNVDANGFHSVDQMAIQVLPGREARLSFTLVRSYSIRGVVVDPTGAPVASARVSAVRHSENSSSYSSTSASADGTFSFDGLDAGEYQLSAEGEGFLGDGETKVVAGSPPVTLRVRAAAQIEVEVFANPALLRAARDSRDVRSRPFSEDFRPLGNQPVVVTVHLRGTDGTPDGESLSANFDDSGRAVVPFNSVAAGRFDLVAEVGDALAEPVPVVATEGVTAHARIDVVASTGVIEGIVTAPDGAAILSGSVSLSGLPSSSRSAAIGSDGRFRFEGLPRGSYSLTPRAKLASAETWEHGGSSVGVTVDGRHVAYAELALEQNSLVISMDGVSLDGASEAAAPAGPELYLPALTVDNSGDAAVVIVAAAGPRDSRLYPGDHLLEVDGTAWTEDDHTSLMQALQGPRNSFCRIVAERPATGEKLTVSLERTVLVGSGPEGRSRHYARISGDGW